MHTEYEVRILEIDSTSVFSKLEEIGAELEWDLLQRRYVYDFIPKLDGKWIRLRTNGIKNTLTIKDVVTSKIDGTKEMEIVVDDFDTTNEILNELGYKPRGIQENKRIKYNLNGVEVDIDTWPRIPSYLEVEGKNEEEVYKTLELLGIPKDKAIALNTQSIYKEIYGIDLTKEPLLSFDK